MYPDDVTQLSLIGLRFVMPKFQARFGDPSSKVSLVASVKHNYTWNTFTVSQFWIFYLTLATD